LKRSNIEVHVRDLQPQPASLMTRTGFLSLLASHTLEAIESSQVGSGVAAKD
jgi:hypothetical protein